MFEIEDNCSNQNKLFFILPCSDLVSQQMYQQTIVNCIFTGLHNFLILIVWYCFVFICHFLASFNCSFCMILGITFLTKFYCGFERKCFLVLDLSFWLLLILKWLHYAQKTCFINKQRALWQGSRCIQVTQLSKSDFFVLNAVLMNAINVMQSYC